VSQRNNDRDCLSGVLAAHADRYIQVVEGPREALDSLLRRLEDDPRHRDLRLLDRASVSERMFEGWAMASAGVTPELERLLGTLMDRDVPSPSWILMALRETVVDAPNEPVAQRRQAG